MNIHHHSTPEAIKDLLVFKLPPPFNQSVTIDDLDVMITINPEVSDIFVIFDKLQRIISDMLIEATEISGSFAIFLLTEKASRSFHVDI
ncbi:hypothetical protein [Mucilaginibacter endophyticus]|uniref:hypothetical protein n=1 Tax=Mucilaginibacter endophyticus TaxID=2675003 RepID=UPI000E0DB270|nr:hypothetical protein [Mucilaginibacter endophyticus]